MKEMKSADFSEIKFLNFPENIRQNIVEEYYKKNDFNRDSLLTIDNYIKNSKDRNKTIGIFQNFCELVNLRNKLEDIIDKIIYNKEIIIEEYLNELS